MPGQQGLDALGRQCPVEQPVRGDPDGHRDGMARPVPAGGLLHRLFQLPAAQLGGAVAVLLEPAAVADPQELGGGEEYALGGAPAGQGGDRRDPAAGQFHHGLVQQRELAVVQGGAQLGGQLGAVHHVGLHLGRVQLDAALAGLFGAVHRQVGVAHQGAGGDTRLGEGDTDAGGDPYVPAVDLVRVGEPDTQPVGDLQDAVFARRVVAGAVAHDQRGELVAAQPRGGVPGPYGFGQSAGGLDQQLVPRLVPDGVVHLLEAVQVDVEHGGARIGGAAAGQRLADPFGEQRPVGQVGERVVRGVVLQLGLEADAFGDVAGVEDEAAVVAVDRGLDVEPLLAARAVFARAETALDTGGRFVLGPGGEESAHLVHHPPQVLGMDEGGQLGADQFLRVPAVDSRGGGADVAQYPGRRGDHDDVAGALHQRPEVVLLLGQFLREGDVVEQHDALADDQGEDDRAAGEEHHTVDAAAVQDVVQDAQRADGGGQVRGERGQRTGDGPGGRRGGR